MVTDADSSNYLAAVDVYESGLSDTQPIQNLDPMHLKRNQADKIKHANFKKEHFRCKTQSEKAKLQAQLALDLSLRCHGEHAAAYSHYKYDNDKVLNHLSGTIGCLLKCYTGIHTDCNKYSLLCCGKAKQNWFTDNPYCDPQFRMCLDEEGENTMRGLIEYRLRAEKIRKVPTLKNTQKCEAANRGITASVPKNITFVTNVAGRVHSAVSRMNWGPGQAIFNQADYFGAPLPAGTRVTRHLLKMDRINAYRKAYKKSSKAILSRYKSKKAMYDAHRHRATTDTYRKNMMLPERQALLREHSYSLRKKYVKLNI